MEGVTAVIVGEGEMILASVLDTMEGGGGLDKIPGVYFKTPRGEIISNPLRAWIEDIDTLPFPDYDLWQDIDTYFYFLGQLWLIGSRGCPYQCTNCEELALSAAVPGKRFRKRDPVNYVQEIAYHFDKYKNRGLRMAHPFDPVFPLDREWTRSFCNAYIRAGLSGKLPFSIFSRGDTFYIGSPRKDSFDTERLQWLVEAGCKEIRIGIEAGSERVRNDIHHKHVTNSQLQESFALFRKYGVITIGYNMLGGPTETKAELWQTFRMNRALRPDKPIFFIYQELAHRSEGLMIDHATASAVPLKKKNYRAQQDRATIQFGEPLESAHYSKRWIMAFQSFCYFYFVFKRAFKLLLRQKHRFVINFFRYMYHGYRRGSNMKIVFAYFLSASGDNLFS
ncbi:MAG: radical SAM protein [Chitinivibrionales bacterium]|nr:radical SAM protein [Chitinivibrionales bacterium]